MGQGYSMLEFDFQYSKEREIQDTGVVVTWDTTLIQSHLLC